MEFTAKSKNDLVFKFKDESFLICETQNGLIQNFLNKHMGAEAKIYYCHSLQRGLPGALATIPDSGQRPFDNEVRTLEF
jgi:hypothetical protein